MSVEKFRMKLPPPWYVQEFDSEYIIGNMRFNKNFTADRLRTADLFGYNGQSYNYYGWNYSNHDHFWISGAQHVYRPDAAAELCPAMPFDMEALGGYGLLKHEMVSTQGVTAGRTFILARGGKIFERDQYDQYTAFDFGQNVNSMTGKFLGEDTGFFYVLDMWESEFGATTCVQMEKVDKNTKQRTVVYSYYGALSLLFDTSQAWFFLMVPRGQTNSRAPGATDLMYVTISKSTFLVTSQIDARPNYLTVPATWVPHVGAVSNVTPDFSRQYFNKHYTSYLSSVAPYTLGLKRVQMDTRVDLLQGFVTSNNAQVCTMSGVPAELTTVFTMVNNVAANIQHNQQLQIYTFSGATKEYLVLVLAPIRRADSAYAPTTDNRYVMVFEINAADTSQLLFKSYLRLDDEENSILFSKDFKTIVASRVNRVRMLNFDEGSGSYVPSYSIPTVGQIGKVAYDNNGLVWILTTDYYLSIISPSNTQITAVTCTQTDGPSSYPATVNFKVTTFSLKGTPLIRTVKLAVSGGTFSGGATVTSVDTAAGQATVGVTVSAPGPVTVTVIDD